MAHCVSNLPLFSQRTFPHFSHHSKRPQNIIKFKAEAAANSTKNIQNQQPPKKRLVQSPPVGLWDGFPRARTTVQQMMDTMDRLMELDHDPGYSRGRTPWEIKEGEREYKMRFDMPGMSRDDVKVWVEEKMLVVKAEKVAGKRRERENGEEEEEMDEVKSYGKYSCRIALPENIEFDKIKAEVRDGVLYITIPKPSLTSKVLDINVE